MTKIVLDNVNSGYDLSIVNNNFQKIEDELNNKVLYRDNPVGETNTIITDVDVNGKKLFNLPTPTLNNQAVPKSYVDDAVFDANGIAVNTFLQKSENLADLLDAAVARTNLGLGTAAVAASTDFASSTHNHSGVYEPADATILKDADIGVSVQGYDAATAKTNADQSWTGSPRATPVTDNDGSFDMNAGLDFLCTPTAGFTLTFTNIAQGQRGSIYLVNGSNYAIAAAVTTKVTSTLLSSISSTGEYWLSYWSPDGTNVLVTHAGDFA